jgi:hypothetical protein
MNQVINSTDVRKNWSEVVDTVVRRKPVFIKRNRDILALLSLEQMDLVLDAFSLNTTICREEDASYTASIEELDLLGNETTIDKLIDLMIDELLEYASEYMDNFDMYYHSTNRKAHFPYIYRVIAHESDREKIKKIFKIKIEDNVNA